VALVGTPFGIPWHPPFHPTFPLHLPRARQLSGREPQHHIGRTMSHPRTRGHPCQFSYPCARRSASIAMCRGSSSSTWVDITDTPPHKKLRFGEFGMPARSLGRDRSLTTFVFAAIRLSPWLFTYSAVLTLSFRRLRPQLLPVSIPNSFPPTWSHHLGVLEYFHFSCVYFLSFCHIWLLSISLHCLNS
jgi:hypothetical protein